jgi:hypothetical protein
MKGHQLLSSRDKSHDSAIGLRSNFGSEFRCMEHYFVALDEKIMRLPYLEKKPSYGHSSQDFISCPHCITSPPTFQSFSMLNHHLPLLQIRTANFNAPQIRLNLPDPILLLMCRRITKHKIHIFQRFPPRFRNKEICESERRKTECCKEDVSYSLICDSMLEL